MREVAYAPPPAGGRITRNYVHRKELVGRLQHSEHARRKPQMRFGCLPPRNAPVISRLRARRATSVLGHAPRAEQPLSTATQDRVCSRASSQDSSATLNRRARAQRSPGTAALQSQQIVSPEAGSRSPEDTRGHAWRCVDDLSRCVFDRHRCRGTAIPPPRITAR